MKLTRKCHVNFLFKLCFFNARESKKSTKSALKEQDLKSYIQWSQMNIIPRFETKKAFEWKVAFKFPFREKNLEEMNQISLVSISSTFYKQNFCM